MFFIGDNTSLHLSLESTKLFVENNIKFIFFPSNSTHLARPFDMALFQPIKMKWRGILKELKIRLGRNEITIPKHKLPGLLKKFLIL